ncbi:winged helix-turn-helix domain-containing protein [Prevotella sp.]|uniref:winged helix-turn-helix domain-containing protein n=1 Tax=Prevotella sp. TaxID=59823 RepID=UPI003FEF4390
MEYNKIGENAGIVWRALNTQKYSWEELLKVTELDPLELACAIGWLARENKLSFFVKTGIIYFELYHETYF